MRLKGLNKKGDVRTIAPTELVGHVLGAMVVFLVLAIAIAFTVLYFSEKDKEIAENNFITLANKIETLSKSGDKFDAQRAFPFYLPPNFVVVGFNMEWNNNKISDGCEPESVRKPTRADGKEGKECENFACLCLFTNNDDFMDGSEYNVGLIKCRSFPEVDYIIAPYLNKNNAKDYNYPSEIWKNMAGEKIDLPDYSSINFNDYAFFYLYGQCEDYYWDKNLESRKVYIEKFTDNDGRAYIFIAPEHEGAKKIEERYEAMNKKYGKLS